MTDYIPTRIDGGLNPEFNSKKELDKLLKRKVILDSVNKKPEVS